MRCEECTVQYSEHTPSEQELPAHYGEYYFHGDPAGYPAYEADELVHRSRATHYLRDLAAHQQRAGRLLDVGCATGFFIDEARRAGWQVRGIDVSAWAAGYARERLNLDVMQGAFPHPALEGTPFNAVTMFNVLEQLPDPRAAEQALRRMVAPGGIVALETWDADALVVRLAGMHWHKYRPRETPIYLNRRSLLRLFPSPCWTLIEYRARTKWIRLEHGLHALGIRPRERDGKGGTGAAPRRTWLARLTNLSVPYRLGDLVWAVLRRERESAAGSFAA